MRGIQGDRHRSEPDVKHAHGETVLVRSQHLLPKCRVALARTCKPWDGSQPNGIEQVLVMELGKVFGEDRLGDGCDQARIACERRPNVRRERGTYA